MTDSVAQAGAYLLHGGVVAIPTETVYGLAADARRPAAVARIFEVKGRPLGHPLIVHTADAHSAQRWAGTLTTHAVTLMEACWPGPLTVLVERAPHVLDIVTGGRSTVGLRVPAHPLTAELLRTIGTGVAAPSANRFGRVSPTTARHVRDDLGDDVDLVLDGGPCDVGVESTIVDCTGDRAQILRSGGIPDDEIRELLSGAVTNASDGPSRAPGMLSSHYAPRCHVVLAESAADAAELVQQHRGDAGLMARLLDCSTDLSAVARTLYADLRAADRDGVDVLVALLPPKAGLGYAIRDRLMKASADRPTD